MPRPNRFVLRLAAGATLLAAISFAANLSPRGGTPYASALSSLGASAALAAPGCEMKICSKPKGGRPADCLSSTLSYNCSRSGGVCAATPC